MKEQSTILAVEGMSCGHCVGAVKELIEKTEGVQSAEVDLGAKEAAVSFNPSITNAQTIIDTINSSNIYKATQK
ncbi:MAG: heavy-metal-associated domain-containing protein [Flavobacteriales bacterium]|nr:heavy-metal-associated domain-containing protein [Flavobacteriales bacterium]